MTPFEVAKSRLVPNKLFLDCTHVCKCNGLEFITILDLATTEADTVAFYYIKPLQLVLVNPEFATFTEAVGGILGG